MGRKRKALFYELVFLGPMTAAFIAVKFVPLVMSAVYSLMDWNGIASEMSFSGLSNFSALLQDRQFWNSLGFTLAFAAVSVGLSNILGFFLASILVKPIRGREALRAAFYIPNTLGGLVLGFIWKFIFLSVFSYLYEKTGLSIFGQAWLSTPATSFWAMVIVQVWVLSGYLMLLYISGLVQIPGELLEAGAIDGAGSLQQLVHIRIPLIAPTITRCIFISFLTCMRVYDINLSLTGGNPYRSSESVTMNIFSTAFNENRMSYGCAKALVFIAIVVAISCIQVRLTSGKEVEA